MSSITYQEFLSDQRLKDYIQCYWYFRIDTKQVKHFDILPDACFDLLIILKGGQIIDSGLTGIWSKSATVTYDENTEVFGIRFTPLATRGLFQFNVKEFLDIRTDLDLRELKINPDELLNTLYGFPEFIVNHLDQHFLRMLDKRNVDQRLLNSFKLIDASIGNLSVETVANEVGLSCRQLYRLVNNMIGIGIKEYSKMVKFRHSIQNYHLNKSFYSNYYDQSHFIRDVKYFTGKTPEQLNILNNDRFVQYYDSSLY
ncbi:MAG: DUF6597 domain-containing transcriptional factor [Hyphomicrobiales bacterium]